MIRAIGEIDCFASKFEYYSKGGVTVFYGDCMEVIVWLKDYCRFTAIVTDPPYGLGFMGKDWDNSVPGKEFWLLFQSVLYPGSNVFSFGGTRTFHRLACAMEDAGLDFCDTLMWLHGQAMPHGANISKHIDRLQGNGREVIGNNGNGRPNRVGKRSNSLAQVQTEGGIVTAPGSEVSALWEGWNTSLKPCWEPILRFQVPTEGTYANNALTYGVAGINVGGCKIGYESDTAMLKARVPNPSMNTTGHIYNMKTGVGRNGDVFDLSKGRWPANVVLSHNDDCKIIGYKTAKGKVINRWDKGAKLFGEAAGLPYTGEQYPDESVPIYECSEDCACKMLDDQSGVLRSGSMNGNYHNTIMKNDPGNRFGKLVHLSQKASQGGASRFFYQAKASSKDRGGKFNNHPTCKPLALMKWLCTLVRMPENNLILDPFCGSGTTLVACQELGIPAIGIEKDRQSFEIASRRIAGV